MNVQTNSPFPTPYSKSAILILIGEDLKSKKFFDTLRSLGLDDEFYQPDLTDIILSSLGLDPNSNHHQHLYNNLLEEYAPQVKLDRPHLNQLAAEILLKLLVDIKRE